MVKASGMDKVGENIGRVGLLPNLSVGVKGFVTAAVE